jgi:hypothetical protein
MGFTLPFEVWMHNGLRSVVERELLDSSVQEHISLDPRQMANIWKTFQAGKTSWSRPWALFVLKRWIRQNIFD